jgi:hypothetical protein
MYCKIISRKVCHLRPGFDPRSRQFSLFHVLLQICRFSPFFILVLFTLLSNLKGRRKNRVVTMVKSFQKLSILGFSPQIFFILTLHPSFLRRLSNKILLESFPLARFFSFSRWFQICNFQAHPSGPLGGLTPLGPAPPPVSAAKIVQIWGGISQNIVVII